MLRRRPRPRILGLPCGLRQLSPLTLSQRSYVLVQGTIKPFSLFWSHWKRFCTGCHPSPVRPKKCCPALRGLCACSVASLMQRRCPQGPEVAYEFLSELGRGEYAHTYLVRRRNTGRELACKEILKGPTPETVARAAREAEVHSSLSGHPNIAGQPQLKEFKDHSILEQQALLEGWQLPSSKSREGDREQAGIHSYSGCHCGMVCWEERWGPPSPIASIIHEEFCIFQHLQQLMGLWQGGLLAAIFMQGR